jgi:hypothetical protein
VLEGGGVGPRNEFLDSQSLYGRTAERCGFCQLVTTVAANPVTSLTLTPKGETSHHPADHHRSSRCSQPNDAEAAPLNGTSTSSSSHQSQARSHLIVHAHVHDLHTHSSRNGMNCTGVQRHGCCPGQCSLSGDRPVFIVSYTTRLSGNIKFDGIDPTCVWARWVQRCRGSGHSIGYHQWLQVRGKPGMARAHGDSIYGVDCHRHGR